jgi:phosphate butyryltransferase
MICKLDEIIAGAQKLTPCKMAVAVAQDSAVLTAVNLAMQSKIIVPILIGDEQQILTIAKEIGMNASELTIVNESDKFEACQIAARLVRDKKAHYMMKGLVDTSLVMKAVLDKENHLKSSNMISHVAVMEVSGFDRLFFVTDSAMAIAPTLEQKIGILENAVKVGHALGNPSPKVAVLCAVEKVNEKMPCTEDAAKMTALNKNGTITGCVVDGPLALDNAVSLEAAAHKGIVSPVAGLADILLVPNLESGNLLNKSMEYFGSANKASIMVGAKMPIVLTSRASSAKSKLYSIALGALIANDEQERGAL